MISSPLLPLTLHALDHLDQAALKRQAETLIAQVHPEATPVQIQAAVETGWEHLPVPLPKVAIPAGPFSFGWRRPKTPEAAHRKQVTWAARRERWLEKSWFSWASVGLILSLATLATASPVLLLGPVTEIIPIGHAMLGLFLGAVTFRAGFASLMHFIHECHKYAICSEEVDFTPYLQIPVIRDYLKAVVSSSVPDLLWGDVRRLQSLLERATRPTRKAEQKQTRRTARVEAQHAKLAARQAKIQAKETQRLAQEREHHAEWTKVQRVAQENRRRLLDQMEPASPAGEPT